MKKLILFLLPLMISSQLFAIAGFGAYGNYDLLKYPGGNSGNSNTYLNYEGFNNAGGFGLLLYIDVLPIVDLEADIELIGNVYKYTAYLNNNSIASEEIPWGRTSTYLTVRKEILGLSIPFLAKAQLYGGIGFNTHAVVPVPTADLIKRAFNEDDIELAMVAFSNDTNSGIKKLKDYLLDNLDKSSGFHIQAGLRGKLFMLNAFVNARYTIAKDVIPDKSGYPSLWVGLAFGI